MSSQQTVQLFKPTESQPGRNADTLECPGDWSGEERRHQNTLLSFPSKSRDAVGNLARFKQRNETARRRYRHHLGLFPHRDPDRTLGLAARGEGFGLLL